MKWAPLVLGLAAVFGSSCLGGEVRPQWTVTVRTDAPLPLVGDRLLVEILDADGALACEACRSVRAAPPGTFPFSFGVVPTARSLRVRVRLHRARAVRGAGTPDPDTTLDTLALLPPTPGPVEMELAMACFGVASQADASCDPATRTLTPVGTAPAPSRKLEEGSWALARAAPCDDAQAPSGMRCAPAGPFFFGSLLEVDEPRDYLTYLSPFYLDVDELSVGRARAAILAGAVGREPRRQSAEPRCVYLGANEARNDDLALNCVDRSLAAALCASEGKSLPTEAQFAAAAGNGALGTRFPWGESTDICAHAVVARSDDTSEPTDCRFAGGTRQPGPARLSDATLDVTFAPSAFRHMGGDLDEWVQDTYRSMFDPYYRSAVPLVDPLSMNRGSATIRGGGWFTNRAFAQSFWRASEGLAGTTHTGFRCAKAVDR
ncbi:MAG: SUMF1/EgtB/PvdO family nonheme iron enzyme [Polyangiaceae bacterium]|nr:SUMF1/EgtB/PvdO family nonheme iron enzyme [Polyangiaceae bacterium]